jgi:hypothetical protein
MAAKAKVKGRRWNTTGDECGRRGVGTGTDPRQGSELDGNPTPTPAGSAGRVAEYGRRAAAGVRLNHPADGVTPDLN